MTNDLMMYNIQYKERGDSRIKILLLGYTGGKEIGMSMKLQRHGICRGRGRASAVEESKLQNG